MLNEIELCIGVMQMKKNINLNNDNLTKENLETFIKNIKPLNIKNMKKKEKELNSLLKTPKGLGYLEDLAIQLSGMVENGLEFNLKRKAVLVMAGDNGVEREQISASHRLITKYVVESMLKGSSSVNALAKIYNTDVIVADLGIDDETNGLNFDFTGIIDKKINYKGTGNIKIERAMSYDEALCSIFVGIKLVKELYEKEYNVIATGEMGIGNTTTSSALLYAISNKQLNIDDIVGRGSGIDDKKLVHKKNVVIESVGRFEKKQEIEDIASVENDDVIEILSQLGGFDIAGMVGIFLGCAFFRIPAIIDGFISSVAALISYKIAPLSKEYMIASHMSEEPGMKYIMETLGLVPPMNMNMKLGEGSGAVLMMPIIEGALNITKDVIKYPKI